MECNSLFNRKRGIVDNLNNAFSYKNIHGVVGHVPIIDGNTLNLTDILYYYIASKLVLINMGVY